jgi:thioredoxin-like negative regulator of GroEL
MRITIPRFVVALSVALLLQGGVFAWSNTDLLYLRQPVAAIVKDDATVFVRNADEALARPKLTRKHLDTIADAAHQLGRPAQEIQALERRVAADPTDRQLRLRLADALRRGGDLSRSEALYREVIGSSTPQDKRP